MVKQNKIFISQFNPEVVTVDDSLQESYVLKTFDAGSGYSNFNDFIADEAAAYRRDGDGVTHVIFDSIKDDSGDEVEKNIVAYFTLNATAIPFEDRIRNDEIIIKKTGEIYDIENCGVSAIEVKLFAVDISYQNCFYEYEDKTMPVSAWVLRLISEIVEQVVGFKVIFLYSLPEDVEFYLKNGFDYIKDNMNPFFGIDQDFIPMYQTIKPFVMNYDE